MRSIRYLDEARHEFLQEVRYFTEVSAHLGERFDAAVRKAEALIAQAPHAGAAYTHGARRVVPGKFKLSIVYLVRPEEIVIIALAPFRRQPGYWRARVSNA